jgi:hypothetical protein
MGWCRLPPLEGCVRWSEWTRTFDGGGRKNEYIKLDIMVGADNAEVYIPIHRTHVVVRLLSWCCGMCDIRPKMITSNDVISSICYIG